MTTTGQAGYQDRAPGELVTGTELHTALCKALEIPEGHGSQVAVARALGVAHPNQYRRIIHTAQLSVATVVHWATRAGLEVVVEPQGEPIGTLRIQVDGQDDTAQS